MSKYTPNMVLSNKTFDVVGTRPIRHDGIDKVTGSAKYGGDVHPSGVLYGYILRSPFAHARIKSINVENALQIEGVKAVVTYKDLNPKLDGALKSADTVGLKYLRDNILASDKVLYKGQAVAAVAATDIHTAEEAVSSINIEYELLPAVLTAPDAARNDAPILHSFLETETLAGMIPGPTNVAKKFVFEHGDIEKGFLEADVVVERQFDAKTVHQGYIETHNAVANWNRDGRLTVWCSTQAPFGVRQNLSKIFGIGVSDIRVIPMEIGGGFGRKIPVYLEPVAAALSKKSGWPVKIQMSRKDVFEGTGPTSGSRITVKIGATSKGVITAADAMLYYEAGAYPGSPVTAGAECIFAPYNLNNVRIEGLDVVVNKPKTAAYRAPGATNAAMASESVMDELADILEMDPIELRLINAAEKGTRRATGPLHNDIGVRQLLEAMKEHDHYNSPLVGPNRGRGIAIGFWFNIGLPSTCTIAVTENGKLNLSEGNPDIGGTRTTIAMQAAEALGLDAHDVNPNVVDTDLIGFTELTAGSRTTFATGYAAYEAALDIKRQMIKRIAKLWGVDSTDIEYSKRVFTNKVDPKKTLTFEKLAGKLNDTGGPIIGTSSVDPKGVGGSVAGNIFDVEVDPETGKVTILRVTAFQDAGKAVHPSYVEGQMQGGSVQGIGWALNEEYSYDENGTMANSSFLDYRLPTALDLPMIDTVILEIANPGHPYGVRGVGEASIVPPPAAIANAVRDAIGKRMTDLPMNPGSVLATIWGDEGPTN